MRAGQNPCNKQNREFGHLAGGTRTGTADSGAGREGGSGVHFGTELGVHLQSVWGVFIVCLGQHEKTP